ncbi:hypothetical protein ACQV5M_20145, partial [Leptospira sp. SA-E8]|uniref:hypothetical protein n=1 Tax=Leptospira sp. SA-E8 TaxID=3422259 RepID=UPI003EBDD12D
TPYMQEPWFKLLRESCEAASQSAVGRALGLSRITIVHVINGLGLYGSGKANTSRIARKVEHMLGMFTCPHLSETSTDGQPVVITGAKCREHAWRETPPITPLALQHWRACQSCPRRQFTAPPKVEGQEVPAGGNKERKS